jgi:outer membrane protein W
MDYFKMLKTKSVVLAILASSSTSFAYANSLDVQNISFNKGDKINIDYCNRNGWCKLDGTNEFVKKFRIVKLRNPNDYVNYKVAAPGNTYVYISNDLLEQDSKLWDYVLQKVSLDRQIEIDFESDYTRASVVKGYFNGDAVAVKPREIKSYKNKVKAPKKSMARNLGSSRIDELSAKIDELNAKINELYAQSRQLGDETPTFIDFGKDSGKSKFFAMASVGQSNLSVDNSVDSNILSSDALDDAGSTYDIGLGYKYSKKMFTTANISKTSLATADVTNYYLSANYTFNKSFNPYIGALIGYSQLKWDKSPVTGTTQEDLTSTGLVYGTQFGASKKIDKDLSVFAQYQIMVLDHKLDVNDGAASVKHTSQNNLTAGVKYEF